MSLFNRLKNLYGNMLTKHFNIFFLAMFTVLFICFIIGGAAMERTPLMVVDSGLHEFGHSMGMYLTGGNVTAILIKICPMPAQVKSRAPGIISYPPSADPYWHSSYQYSS
jgi:hypothetical protein